MAQLPPKVPHNWPNSFPHHQPTMTSSNFFFPAAAASAAVPETHQPSWIDEFMDFSSARRGAHRRCISDSIAFLEAPLLADDEEETRNESTNNNNAANNNNSGNDNAMHGFDRLDDEQLLSMFSDDVSIAVPPATSNPSTPSDQNSNNEEKTVMDYGLAPQQLKQEPGEVESPCINKSHEPQPPFQQLSNIGDTIIDPKRVKRILANRQSAQRSRVRKLQYISELERSVTTLQTEVSALSPRVAFLDHQRLILNVDNSTLKQRIAALAQDKIFKDAHQEALKKEIERLRQVYHQQNLKKMNSSQTQPSVHQHHHHHQQQQQHQHQQQQQQQPPSADSMVCTDTEQLLS
ncbi:basic leucine zipper 61-like [Carica papaya]|uniref:basic leucine zipper 61-like n=1 Tax=Carica papaya TaxID=3649 RepID=UPI000B8CA3BD|nr:basic leucine zipper 61-like [Carica papaya]